MQSCTSEAVISASQQAYEDVVGPLLTQCSSCALIDFPNHTNVGDSAIWLGMKKYLFQRNIAVKYQCDRYTYRKKSLQQAVDAGAVIIFHGGGNFGDLWEEHQILREKIIADFPNSKIIQFPQTIYFRDQTKADHFASLLSTHKNIHILVRDSQSVSYAKQFFDADVRLCPDSAIWLWPLKKPAKSDLDILWLARTDKESIGEYTLTSGVRVVDWIGGMPSLLVLACYVCSHISVFFRRCSLPPLSSVFAFFSASLFDRVAQSNVRRGAALLSRAKVVITDRLHGHLLCLLLEIPHVVLDNNYGKVSHYFASWSQECTTCKTANTPDEALHIAQTMLSMQKNRSGDSR